MAITIKYNDNTDAVEFHLKTTAVLTLDDVTAYVATSIADNPEAGKGLPKRQDDNWPGKPAVKALVEDAFRRGITPDLALREDDPDRWARAERIVANARLV